MNNRVKEIYNDLKNNRNGWVIDENGFVKSNIALVDTLDIITELDNLWCDEEKSKMYDTLFETNDAEDYVVWDNSYNFGAKVTNDYDWKTIAFDNGYVTRVMFHKCGDIRGNYTDNLYIEHDYADNFIVLLMDCMYGKQIYINYKNYDLCFEPSIVGEEVAVWCDQFDDNIEIYEFEITDEVCEYVINTFIKKDVDK